MQAPNPAEVEAELEHILSSKTFKKSAVLSNFLRYIVMETIHERAHEIKEYNIAVKGLGKPSDFNPQIDAMIRINAGRLRRLLMEYYEEEGEDDPISISMARGSYVPAFANREKKGATVNSEPVVASQRGVHVNTVAVLPFRNLSGSPESDFLVDGFCEQLSADLAQFQEIKVIAYYSASKIRDTKQDIRQVGRELSTSHLITGSIYRDTTLLRVSIQLNNAITGLQLWAKTYERDIHSSYVYDIFNDIIKQVVPIFSGYYGLIIRSNPLSTQLDPSLSNETIDALFWFYHYDQREIEEIFQMALTKIKKSLELDPNYALAWAILAHLYIDGVSLGYLSVSNPLEEADRCIEKALQLDHDCQHAYLSLSFLHIMRREKNKGIKAIERCLSINKRSSYFLTGACFVYGVFAEYDKCLEYFQQTIGLNPYYPWWLNLGPVFTYFYLGNYEEALDFANRIHVPGIFWNDIFRIAAQGQLGRTENLQEMVDKFQIQFPGIAPEACSIFKQMLFDDLVYDRIIEGLQKAGLPV